jgi:hypothetical protein
MEPNKDAIEAKQSTQYRKRRVVNIFFESIIALTSPPGIDLFIRTP